MSRVTRALACGLVLGLLAGVLVPPAAGAGKTVLRLRVDGPMAEGPNDAAGLMAVVFREKLHSLREWVQAVRRAAADPGVHGLVLIVEQPEVSLAQTEEMIRAVRQFRERGKPVYCYLDWAGNAAYALAAAADHVTLAENSLLGISGLHAEALYFKGLMDKLGLQVDAMHCGAYKSALEPFTRTEPSPEAAENINWLLDGVYARWLELIAEGRRLSVEEVRALVDEAPLSPERALAGRLVDAVGTFDAFAERVRKAFGPELTVLKEYDESAAQTIDWQNPFAVFEFLGRLLEGAGEPTEPGIALIYIEGPIVPGESEEDGFGGPTAGSTTVRAALDEALEDGRIKAVVVRVDSPGGSALASDIIWSAATRCAARKPLIVSMGGVAGSGGYYVAIPGDTILAEASTITGSIGVVGGKLVWSGLMEDKLGITTTTFSRGRRAGLMTPSRPWTEDERAFMRSLLDDIYEQFKGRVLASRGPRLKQDLEQIAGGRVYTGAQALELGLVDQLGGLAEALALAASRGGLPADCRVYVLPKPSELTALLDLFEQLSGGKDRRDEFEIAAGPGGRTDPLLRSALPLLRGLAPDQAAEVGRALRNLLILRREGVGCFMPTVPRFR